jgi:hypothetical protein
MVVLAQSPSGQCAQSSSQAKIATVMLGHLKCNVITLHSVAQAKGEKAELAVCLQADPHAGEILIRTSGQLLLRPNRHGGPIGTGPRD